MLSHKETGKRSQGQKGFSSIDLHITKEVNNFDSNITVSFKAAQQYSHLCNLNSFEIKIIKKLTIIQELKMGLLLLSLWISLLKTSSRPTYGQSYDPPLFLYVP